MPAVSPADGPIAITGASGYIGSWIVQDCVQQGYDVRACVRHKGAKEKVDHLLALNDAGLRGSVELWEADLGAVGSYDDAFKGACAVIHAGAAMAYNLTPQQVYDGCFTEVHHLLDSVIKSGSVRRFVFTSSFAAVGHPRPPGYVFTEKDWCGDNVEAYKGRWSAEMIPKDRDIAYAMAKAECEKLCYATAEQHGGFEAFSILPLNVIGPLMCHNHNQPFSWHNCIGRMLNGKPHKRSPGGRMLWNNVDVRDTARAHRLCCEVPSIRNGSRYILSASDRSGELTTWELQQMLQRMYPGQKVGGEEMGEDGKPKKKTHDLPRSYCLLAKQELGLRTYSIEETVRDTAQSLFALGIVSPPASAKL